MSQSDKAELWWHGWMAGASEYAGPRHAESWRECPYYRAGYRQGQEAKAGAAREAKHAFGVDPSEKGGG